MCKTERNLNPCCLNNVNFMKQVIYSPIETEVGGTKAVIVFFRLFIPATNRLNTDCLQQGFQQAFHQFSIKARMTVSFNFLQIEILYSKSILMSHEGFQIVSLNFQKLSFEKKISRQLFLYARFMCDKKCNLFKVTDHRDDGADVTCFTFPKHGRRIEPNRKLWVTVWQETFKISWTHFYESMIFLVVAFFLKTLTRVRPQSTFAFLNLDNACFVKTSIQFLLSYNEVYFTEGERAFLHKKNIEMNVPCRVEVHTNYFLVPKPF